LITESFNFEEETETTPTISWNCIKDQGFLKLSTDRVLRLTIPLFQCSMCMGITATAFGVSCDLQRVAIGGSVVVSVVSRMCALAAHQETLLKVYKWMCVCTFISTFIK
jgi:hypothetical protein